MTKIKTSIELSELVWNDTENHAIKKLAKLFLAAMNNWPSKNHISIEDFMSELTQFYAKEITIKNIKSKKIDLKKDYDSWYIESGSHIIEFLLESKRNFNITNFDVSLEKVLNYYSNINTNK